MRISLSVLLLILCFNINSQNSYEFKQRKSLASEPLTNPDSIGLAESHSYSYSLNIYPSLPSAEKYILIRKTNSPFTNEDPIDSLSYFKGSYIGDAQVVYIGKADTIIRLISEANTTYYHRLIAFNGIYGLENYNIINVPEKTLTTSDGSNNDYYQSLSPWNYDFINSLHLLINPHTILSYYNFEETIVHLLDARDTVISGISEKVINCAYSNQVYIYTEPFTWSWFNREHIFCQSWMPTSNLSGYDFRPEYSDYFNLLPIIGSSVNGVRSNYPLGIVDEIISTYKDAKYGFNVDGNRVYEPCNAIKGNVARAMFYMVICYNSVGGFIWNIPSYISTSIPYAQNQDILKQWNLSDPPDNYEKARNDYVFSMQGNRNPFIDHPDWANNIDFTNLTYNNILAEKKPSFNIYPNPAKNNLNISFKENNNISEIQLFDLLGHNIKKVQIPAHTNAINIDISDLSNGNYIIIFRKNSLINIERIIINKD